MPVHADHCNDQIKKVMSIEVRECNVACKPLCTLFLQESTVQYSTVHKVDECIEEEEEGAAFE